MLAHLADVSIRSLLLALIAAIVLWMLRSRRTAALQHAIWAAVVCGMLALFALGAALPRLPLRILDHPAAAPVQSTPPVVGTNPPMFEEVPLAIPTPTTLQRSIDWSKVATYAYATIAFAFLARFMTGIFLVRRLLTGSAQGGAGFQESGLIAVPLTVGWLRPKILLPREWREWDRLKLDAVMAHEGAHVRRRDGLVAALAGINRCIFWFHPLAWWLERKLTRLSELACDESCVATLGNREEYARLLLDMARVVDGSQGRLRQHALTMAAGSHLRRRIDSILQEGRTSSRGLTWTGWAAIALCGIPVVLGAGAVTLDRQPPLLPLAMPRLEAPAPPPLLAQAQPTPPAPPPAPAATPKFDVVSIRPGAPGAPEGSIMIRQLGNGVLDVTYPLALFIQLAFQAKPFEIEGAPAWVASARYDIHARATEPATARQMWPMLLPVLEDRFKLKVHREKKEMAVYELSLSKSGKLPAPKEGVCFVPDPVAPPPPPVRVAPGGHLPLPCDSTLQLPLGRGRYLYGEKVRMATLASSLTDLLGRPVVDKTGIIDVFDFDVRFTPDDSTPGLAQLPPSADPPGLPNIFTALQDQLGLRVKSAKDLVEVIVIDRIERPTEN
jgi:bla regulator protein blaR1